jgi:hypothetical protein
MRTSDEFALSWDHKTETMSIWQNFKEADHSFEKNFFKVIFFAAITISACVLISKVTIEIPEVKLFFATNQFLLKVFLFTGIGLCIFSFTAYFGSLDSWEEESESSLSASLVSSLLWSIFWISWAIYCAWLTTNFVPVTMAVKITIACLVIIPSVMAYFISTSLRKEMLQQIKERRSGLNENDNSALELLATERKYFSGYFGLLCLPVYIISIVIYQP